jgi:putative transposase
MLRQQLSDRGWARLDAILKAEGRVGRPSTLGDRNFFEAVLWWRRTGVPWRDLPAEFGPWKTIFNRFDRWAKRGRWRAVFAAMQDDVDDEWHCIDSTINRAHQHAAGGKGGLRPTRSGARAAACRPRFTSWSTPSGYPWPSRSQRASDTTTRRLLR